MARFLASARRFVRSEDAPTMVEYGLLIALIAIVVAAAATTLGVNTKALYTTVAGSV